MSKKTKHPIADDDIEQCFKVFDEEDNGYLTIRDLERVFLSLGQRPSEEELKEMLRFIDPANEDGLVQFEGIILLLNSLVLNCREMQLREGLQNITRPQQ